MHVEYVIPGAAIFAIGFCILFGLLASVGALAKSKQFAAVAMLASGRAGAGKRTLFYIAIASLAFGACGAFAGAATSDGQRAKACARMCESRGYVEGKIGPSDRSNPAAPRFVACTCTGGSGGAPFETRADELSF